MSETIIIAIDPDMIASGIAVVKNKKEIVELTKKDINELVPYIKLWAQNHAVLIKIEDPNMISPTFPRVIKKAISMQAVRDKISQDVGRVKASATLIIQIIEHAGFSVQRVKPVKGPVKKLCKNDSAYFNKVFNWSGRSNEDNRDAAIIAVYG